MDEDAVERAAKDADKAAQEARAKKYGIAVKEGGAITKPSEWQDVPDSDWGDPVNYRYPMKDVAHANNAASRWGDASNRSHYSSAEQKIIGDRIAARQKTLGVQSAQDKENRMTDPVVVRADGSHDPFTGSHSHSHPAFGSQGDDQNHSHHHSHKNDADHHHGHDDKRAEDAAVTRSEDTATGATMFAPITRIDTANWIIEGQATSDVTDHYDTFFDYESSKRAFGNWAGNIREMHQPKAVGSAIEWKPDDENHRIVLRAKISKGAPDTWEKILDGTLRGFSIALPPGRFKVSQVERNGRAIPMYHDFDLAEVSVVDSPGSPGCNFQIVRGDFMLTDILDTTTEPAATKTDEPPQRAGARISHVTQSTLHQMRDSHLSGAKQAMQLCDCDDCKAGASYLDPDGDGDIDIPGSPLDYDGDAGKGDMSGRAIETAVTRAVAPTLQRVNAFLAQSAATQQTPPTIDTSAIERRLDAIEQRTADVAHASDIAEVRSLVSEVKELAETVKGLAERIAAQPAAGGPIANGAAMEKLLAGQPAPQMNDAAVVQRAAQLGLLPDQEQQLRGAALQIRQMIPANR